MSKAHAIHRAKVIARYLKMIHEFSRLMERLEETDPAAYRKIEGRATFFMNQLSGVEQQHVKLVDAIFEALGGRTPPSSRPPTRRSERPSARPSKNPGARLYKFTLHPPKKGTRH